ncbi:MAG TPA: FKBP-type peptidyl-prolyl cis-trans isomerase [Chitinophagaceae bacterium]|nr:FKBP-type peptidyl-prolyl cis-trans isomerase [Chitinophagaceae bacterium]
MQKIIPFLLICTVAFSSCLKKDKGCQYSSSATIAPASEQQAVQTYLTNNGITAIQHSSGFYYKITNAGSGMAPTLCSAVRVAYTGKLTNGNIFDSDTDVTFELGVLIEGWKKGVPLIQKGGKITLYIPPSLGYGPSDIKDANNNVIIPGNSILIFDIELLDVQ